MTTTLEALPVRAAALAGDPLTLKPTAMTERLRWRLQQYKGRNGGRVPSRWLIAPRIAREVIAELRPLLQDDPGGVINPQELSMLFGVPVTVVDDLPQGAVFR